MVERLSAQRAYLERLHARNIRVWANSSAVKRTAPDKGVLIWTLPNEAAW
jgi:hypothetical protein